MISAPSAFGRYWFLMVGIAGLALIVTGLPSAAEQFLAPISEPPPLILNQYGQGPSALRNEDDTWSQIKALIMTFENLPNTVEPDQLYSILNLNKSLFIKSKKTLNLGYSTDRRSRFVDVQYENVPDNNNKIYISLSVSEQFNATYPNNMLQQDILFSVSPINVNWPCISFPAIEGDLKKMNWDGRYPGFYRGLHGASIPDYDVVYLRGKNIDDLLITIYLSKNSSCILRLDGHVQNWKVQNNVK